MSNLYTDLYQERDRNTARNTKIEEAAHSKMDFMDDDDDSTIVNIFASSTSSPSTSSNSASIRAAPVSRHEPFVWIFGYGSLCWFPGTEYNSCIIGYIRGYERRFWQGNTTHRGTKDNPGRVATLIESADGVTWGCAFKVTGQPALDYLNNRECTLGGYTTVKTKFFPRIGIENSSITGETFPAVIYIATANNDHWLGRNSPYKIAKQIAACRGPSGHNVEYLMRLAIFMREEIPNASDDHLFTLEKLVLSVLKRKRIPLESLMGTNDMPRPRYNTIEQGHSVNRPTTFEFTSRVPKAKLRCLNV